MLNDRRRADRGHRLPRAVVPIALVVLLLASVVIDPGRILSRTLLPVPTTSATARFPTLATAGMGATTARTSDTDPSRTGPRRPEGVEQSAAGARDDGGMPTSEGSMSGTTALRLEEVRGGWRMEAGVEEAMALASVSGHLWARSHLTAQGGSVDAAPVVVVEAVERPGTDDVVVTLLIAPLAHADRSTGAATSELIRLGVPVRLGPEGAALAGAPWRLPAPRLGLLPQELQGSAVVDTLLLDAARHALERVGIDGRRLTALEATDGWPFIARLDDTAQGTGHPWLRWHVDRFVVAGLPLHIAAIETHGAPGGRDIERKRDELE